MPATPTSFKGLSTLVAIVEYERNGYLISTNKTIEPQDDP
jgi:hypothetical protein